MKASALAKRLEYDLAGDDYDITGIAYYDEASISEIAIINHKSEIDKTKAAVLLANPVFVPTAKSFLMTYDNIQLAMAKVCSVLIEEGLLKNYELPHASEMNEEGFYMGCGVAIGEDAFIHPGVVIGNDVKIGAHCIIEPFAVIGSGTVIADYVHIGSGSRIGADSFFHYYDEYGRLLHFYGCGQTFVGERTHIGSNSVVQRGTLSDTVIGKSCMIGNCVDIGHDVKIGNDCKIVSQAGIAGNAVLKDKVVVYGQAGIANNVVIGNNVVIKAKTAVSKSIEDNKTVFGIFGRDYKEELRLAIKVRRYFERKEI